MLAETRESGTRKTRVDADGLKIPLNLLRSSTSAQQGPLGARVVTDQAAVTLRVLKKGPKNKMEALEASLSPWCSDT